MHWLILSLFALGSSSGQAEYRAFELVISNSQTGEERVILSMFDPLQYQVFYPVRPDEMVQYRDTWRCRGNTSGHQPICAKPERAPASPPQTQP